MTRGSIQAWQRNLGVRRALVLRRLVTSSHGTHTIRVLSPPVHLHLRLRLAG
jgi:hypothetical protein